MSACVGGGPEWYATCRNTIAHARTQCAVSMDGQADLRHFWQVHGTHLVGRMMADVSGRLSQVATEVLDEAAAVALLA